MTGSDGEPIDTFESAHSIKSSDKLHQEVTTSPAQKAQAQRAQAQGYSPRSAKSPKHKKSPKSPKSVKENVKKEAITPKKNKNMTPRELKEDKKPAADINGLTEESKKNNLSSRSDPDSIAMPGANKNSEDRSASGTGDVDGSLSSSGNSLNEEVMRRFDSPVRSPAAIPARASAGNSRKSAENQGGATGSSQPSLPRIGGKIPSRESTEKDIFSPRAEGKEESEYWRNLTNQLLRGKQDSGSDADGVSLQPPVDDKVACKIVCLSTLRKVKNAHSSGSTESPLTHHQISMVFDYIFRMLDAYAHELVNWNCIFII